MQTKQAVSGNEGWLWLRLAFQWDDEPHPFWHRGMNVPVRSVGSEASPIPLEWEVLISLLGYQLWTHLNLRGVQPSTKRLLRTSVKRWGDNLIQRFGIAWAVVSRPPQEVIIRQTMVVLKASQQCGTMDPSYLWWWSGEPSWLWRVPFPTLLDIRGQFVHSGAKRVALRSQWIRGHGTVGGLSQIGKGPVCDVIQVGVARSDVIQSGNVIWDPIFTLSSNPKPCFMSPSSIDPRHSVSWCS